MSAQSRGDPYAPQQAPSICGAVERCAGTVSIPFPAVAPTWRAPGWGGRRRVGTEPASHAPLAGDRLRAAPLRQSSPGTLTLVTPRAPSDLDPHSAYDAGSGVALQGPFEGLIRLKRGTTDEYEPVLAESWEANADESRWTFRLREGVRFQDGTPLDAFAARASFERLFALGLAPSTVLGRFITDAAQISAPDRRTLVFDLGRPQPLFLAALAADFGTAIVNVAALKAHEVDGDWGHAWAQTSSEGLGTGPYRITEFDVETGVILERNAGYWRGWEGDHFDRVILRVVAEPETRRALIENGDADIAAVLPLTTVRELEREPGSGRRPAIQPDRPLPGDDRRRAAGVTGSAPGALLGLSLRRGHRRRLRGIRQAGDRPGRRVVPRLRPGHVRLRDGPGAGAGAPAGRRGGAGNHADDAAAAWESGGAEHGRGVPRESGSDRIGARRRAGRLRHATSACSIGDLPAEERPNLLPAFWSPDYNDAWNQLWPQVSCQAWQAGNGGHYCNERVEALAGADADRWR